MHKTNLMCGHALSTCTYIYIHVPLCKHMTINLYCDVSCPGGDLISTPSGDDWFFNTDVLLN